MASTKILADRRVKTASSEDIDARIFYDIQDKKYRGLLVLSRSDHDEKDYIALLPDYVVEKEFVGDSKTILNHLQSEAEFAEKNLWILENETDQTTYGRYALHGKDALCSSQMKNWTEENIKAETKRQLTQIEYKAQLAEEERLRLEKIYKEAETKVNQNFDFLKLVLI